jgi:hypothetical protein
MLKAKASDHASRDEQFSPSQQRSQTALASGVALLAATQPPAKAGPTFDLNSSTSMLQLVKSGGGMGGGGGGGGGRFNLGGGGMGGHNGGV